MLRQKGAKSSSLKGLRAGINIKVTIEGCYSHLMMLAMTKGGSNGSAGFCECGKVRSNKAWAELGTAVSKASEKAVKSWVAVINFMVKLLVTWNNPRGCVGKITRTPPLGKKRESFMWSEGQKKGVGARSRGSGDVREEESGKKPLEHKSSENGVNYGERALAKEPEGWPGGLSGRKAGRGRQAAQVHDANFHIVFRQHNPVEIAGVSKEIESELIIYWSRHPSGEDLGREENDREIATWKMDGWR